MLVSLQHKLAFLAVPKTGTTAIEQALRPDADIILRGNPQVKHMNAETFEKIIRPYLENLGAKDVRTLAVMRQPLEWLESWYFYRRRIDGTDKQIMKNSTKNVSWSEFIEAYLEENSPRKYARVGSQTRFLGCREEGQPRVDIIFSYAQMDDLMRYLSRILERDVMAEKINVSKRENALLSPALSQRLEEALASENAFYQRVWNGEFHPKN